LAKRHVGLKPGNWVRVTWHDAASHDEGWTTQEELENAVQLCVTAGIVVKRDKKQVLLAMSKGVPDKPGDDTQYATTWAIPIAWISKTEVWPV